MAAQAASKFEEPEGSQERERGVTMFELLLLSMLLFTGFCAVVLVWGFFDAFVPKGNENPVVATTPQPHQSDQNSRL